VIAALYYNPFVKHFLATLFIVIALGGNALAAGGESRASASAGKCTQACGDCAPKCLPCAAKCKPCSVIEPERCVKLAGGRCRCIKHMCATPLYPCGDYRIPDACHKPPVTWAPCGDVRIPPVCHKPATPLRVETCGECVQPLAGSREFIASPCACGKCGGDAKQPLSCQGRGEDAPCAAEGWSN
jgi:hypothetical protein